MNDVSTRIAALEILLVRGECTPADLATSDLTLVLGHLHETVCSEDESDFLRDKRDPYYRAERACVEELAERRDRTAKQLLAAYRDLPYDIDEDHPLADVNEILGGSLRLLLGKLPADKLRQLLETTKNREARGTLLQELKKRPQSFPWVLSFLASVAGNVEDNEFAFYAETADDFQTWSPVEKLAFYWYVKPHAAYADEVWEKLDTSTLKRIAALDG